TNTTTKISSLEDYSDLAMDPGDPQTLFAAVGSYYGASVNGIYKTTNGGNSWTAAGNFPRGFNNGSTKIAIAPTNDLVIYASIADPLSDGLAKMTKSVDGGVTWKQLTGVPNYLGGQGSYDSALVVDPSSADIIYAGGQADLTGGIIRSLNGGTTWTDVSVDN